MFEVLVEVVELARGHLQSSSPSRCTCGSCGFLQAYIGLLDAVDLLNEDIDVVGGHLADFVLKCFARVIVCSPPEGLQPTIQGHDACCGCRAQTRQGLHGLQDHLGAHVDRDRTLPSSLVVTPVVDRGRFGCLGKSYSRLEQIVLRPCLRYW